MKKPLAIRQHSMDPNNPTPEELVRLKLGQAKRWAELDAKPTWTFQEFEEALYCHSEYSDELGGWLYSEASIQKLAFDARTPDDQAKKLQQVAHQMKKL